MEEQISYLESELDKRVERLDNMRESLRHRVEFGKRLALELNQAKKMVSQLHRGGLSSRIIAAHIKMTRENLHANVAMMEDIADHISMGQFELEAHDAALALLIETQEVTDELSN